MGQPGNFFPKPQPLSEREATLIVEQAMERALVALHAEPRGPRRPALARRIKPARAASVVHPVASLEWLRRYPEQAIIGLALLACLVGLATHPFN